MANPRYLTKEKQEEYIALCEKGIGWNIPYAKGTFYIDENGKRKLKQTKTAKLYEDIMSPYITYITVEGGKRGGKDVFALYSWANFLMNTPDKLHLVTGNSQSHAIQTVFEADGFGLKYLLPHGEMYNEDNRKIYKFIDYYGIVKQIFFFGGSNSTDYEAFEGITFGSHYANEAINQHIETIKKAATRTFASKFRKIIHTQNPKAGLFEYYTEYERPLKADLKKCADIDKDKDKYEQNKEANTQKVIELKKKAKVDTLKKYLTTFNYKNLDQLMRNEEVYKSYKIALRNVFMQIDKKAEPFIRHDILNFEPYYANPNGVRNGLNFRYFHFDFYDNLAMNDLDRHKIEDSYDKNSIIFKRDVRGIRASSDAAVYDTFTEENILRGAKPYYYEGRRYISVDYGMRNDFVAGDCEVIGLNVSKVWTEVRVHPQEVTNNGELPTDTYYADKIIELINSKNDGKYIAVIIDPSARSLINELRNRKIRVMKARNDVGLKEKPDKKVEGTMIGVRLVRQAFEKKKLFIHESCVEGIEELNGYSLDTKYLEKGQEEILKVRDHFPDIVRYLLNTIIRNEKKLDVKEVSNG